MLTLFIHGGPVGSIGFKVCNTVYYYTVTLKNTQVD